MNNSYTREGFKFFFQVCLKGCWFYIFYFILASVYWGFDVNFRPLIIGCITGIFETVPKNEVWAQSKYYIYLFIFTMLLQFIILRFSRYLRVYFNPYLKTKIMDYFISDIMSYIDIIDNKNINTLSNKIQEIVKKVSSIISLLFINSFAHFSALSVSLYKFYLTSSLLFFVLIGLIFVFFSLSLLSYFKGIKLSANENLSEMEIFSQYNDILNNIFHLKIFGNYYHERDRLSKYYFNYKKNAENRLFFEFFVVCILSGLFILYHIVSLILLIFLYQRDLIQVKDFCIVLLLNTHIPDCLWAFVDDIASLSENIGVIGRLLEDLKMKKSLCIDSAYLDNCFFEKYDITFDNVSFEYSKNVQIFDNLSFCIEDNSKVGIIGYSGSGKSTIVNLLLKLCKVNSGVIKIGGYDINNLSSIQINSLITVMTQDLSLFNRSIRDNIGYSKLDASEKEIKKAAKLANIDEFIENLPNGYDTMIQNNGRELSYGQKQRILIARSFLKNSPILILDEATASLDNKSEKVVLTSLKKLMKNKTVLVIAHKLYTLQNLDYLMMLENGKFVAKGSHSELLKNNKKYKELCSQINQDFI